MEAKDTVMSEEDIKSRRPPNDGYSYYTDFGLAIANVQAEISFRAGYDEAVKFCHRQFDLNLPEIMETSKQFGMKEVVRWVSHNIYFTDNQDMPRLFSVWKIKLKEWGIND